jgi:hypothetical protein
MGWGDTRTQRQDGDSISLLWKSMIEILFSFPTQFFPRFYNPSSPFQTLSYHDQIDIIIKISLYVSICSIVFR